MYTDSDLVGVKFHCRARLASFSVISKYGEHKKSANNGFITSAYFSQRCSDLRRAIPRPMLSAFVSSVWRAVITLSWMWVEPRWLIHSDISSKAALIAVWFIISSSRVSAATAALSSCIGILAVSIKVDRLADGAMRPHHRVGGWVRSYNHIGRSMQSSEPAISQRRTSPSGLIWRVRGAGCESVLNASGCPIASRTA